MCTLLSEKLSGEKGQTESNGINAAAPDAAVKLTTKGAGGLLPTHNSMLQS
jgi:hypothetical protein